jgi:hypothetical protein
VVFLIEARHGARGAALQNACDAVHPEVVGSFCWTTSAVGGTTGA